MKEELCRAFCNEITVKDVPVGLAVSTAFRRADGDAVGFYVVRDETLPGLARLEDDGQTIPYLEACGVDFETATRSKAFSAILAEHGAEYDEEEAVIRTGNMRQADLPAAALRFVSLLLRMTDFLLLREEHVESTFKEDAAKRIKEAIGTRATVREQEPVSPRLTEMTPDLVLQAPNRIPVAIFLSQSPTRVHEAVILQMAALHEAKEPLSVVALLEKESTLPQHVHRLARNRLTTVTTWEGDAEAAVARIEREVLGSNVAMH